MLTKLGLGDEWDEIKETSFSVQNQPGAQEPQGLSPASEDELQETISWHWSGWVVSHITLYRLP